MSKTNTIVKMARDGTLSRVRGGRKVVVKPARPKTMTEAQVLAAEKADPDNRPLTAKALAGMKPVARVRTLRRALSLTQEEADARQHRQAARLARLPRSCAGGLYTNASRSMAGYACCGRSAGHAPASVRDDAELTLEPDHSMGADQS